MSTNRSNFSRVTNVILVLWCPLVVQAAKFAGGTGEPNNPYQVATAQQLISIGSDSGLCQAHFILVNDLDLDPNLPGGQVCTGAIIAAGTPTRAAFFQGSFDGRGHTIKNLVIRAQAPISGHTLTAGLFGWIDRGAVVRNLKIEAADVGVIDSRVGILVGENAGRVINCHVSGRVSNGGASVSTPGEMGGLAGVNAGDIVNCQADMDLVWGGSDVGGLVGVNSVGRIVGCRATCKQVRTSHYSAGGLVGTSDGYIIGSYALGTVVGENDALACGGLAGGNWGTILNCHAGSDVAAGAHCSCCGGLVGGTLGTILNCYATGSVSTQSQYCSIGGLAGSNTSHGGIMNSYAVGKISLGTNKKGAGGLVGYHTGGDVKMSFWDIETSGMAASAAGQGLTTAQMQQAATFLEAGWDFVDERVNGITDPWRMPEGGGYPVLTLGFDGDSPRRLAGEGTAAAPYRIGTSDDLGIMWRHDPGACYQLVANLDLAGIRWLGAPIASFSGTFGGGGFVISHLTLHESRMAGLFGFLGSNALVKDLGIADANIIAPDEAQDLGVLAGKSYYETDVTRCYATGRLSAGRRSFALGGLIGRNYSIVTDCYTKVDLSCGEKSGCLGGLLGYDHGAVIHSYAGGAVVTPDPNMTCGGLTGTSIGTLYVNNCYFLAPSDGGGPNNGLGFPLTDARMKQPTSFAFWDFKNTWMICAGKDYPRLQWEKITCDQP